MEGKKIKEYFEEVETIKEHKGYYYNVGQALEIVILGTLCGLRNVNQIHQWANSHKVSPFLQEHFDIKRIPCYYWLLCLLKIIKSKSLNDCFIKWTEGLLGGRSGLTIAFDGKTIRSTGKIDSYEQTIEIVSAHVAELGVTLGQLSIEDDGSEIPTLRSLIKLLHIKGNMVVADALHCQKESAALIIQEQGDYLLNVKGNQGTLLKDIEEYVQEPSLQKEMNKHVTEEKNKDRFEKRSAYTTTDIKWLYAKEQWSGLACIGAVRRQVKSKKGESDRWSYYISSKALSAEELLRYARNEWSVETMHWLLDVHFREDFCMAADKNLQENLNIVRKIAINCIRAYKHNTNSKKPISHFMLDSLLDLDTLLLFLQN